MLLCPIPGQDATLQDGVVYVRPTLYSLICYCYVSILRLHYDQVLSFDSSRDFVGKTTE
jgi:hypothetical protein